VDHTRILSEDPHDCEQSVTSRKAMKKTGIKDQAITVSGLTADPSLPDNPVSEMMICSGCKMENKSSTIINVPLEPVRLPEQVSISQSGEEPVKIPLLYVDDDPDQLTLCKIFLEKTGDFRVDTAVSPKTALKMIPLYKYFVIVSDYQMPEMNGVEFFEALKRAGIALPFVLFTAREWEEIFPPGSNDWKDCYVRKSGNARAQYAELGQIIRKAATSRGTCP